MKMRTFARLLLISTTSFLVYIHSAHATKESLTCYAVISGETVARPASRHSGVETTIDYGLLVPKVDTEKKIEDVELQPNGTYAMVRTADGFFIYDQNTGELIRRLPAFVDNGAGFKANHVVWSPSGRYLVYPSRGGRTYLMYDSQSGDSLILSRNFVQRMADPHFSPSGEFVSLRLATGEVVVLNASFTSPSFGQVLSTLPARPGVDLLNWPK